MGMSGAFGGSTTQAWSAVSEYLASLAGSEEAGSGLDQAPMPDDLPVTPAKVQEPEPKDSSLLASLIAKALQSDDPAIRPGTAPRSTGNDSGLSYGRLVGRPRRIGTNKPPPTSGRRQIAAAVGKAGRAIGAGYALAGGNPGQLAAYGLDLRTLHGYDRFRQIFTILEAVGVENSGPDDIALRYTVFKMLDRIIDSEAEAPSPQETLLELVGTYTTELLSIELEAMIQRGKVPVEMVNSHRRDLGDYIMIRANRLDIRGARLTNPEQFEHAARELLRATLDILSAGVLS